ncbi:MAG TPA: chlorite dismutase family protein [Methylomirabilota bacterium]|jgi:chlorite dismutase|nr:chlorite dismutase family protein [Methylomirabilota bacterium]
MSAQSGPPAPSTPAADVSVEVVERGANQQTSSRRLFMQLQVFGGGGESKPLVAALEARGMEAVLYADVNDPRGVGVLALAEDPTVFVTGWRDLLGSEPFAGLSRQPDLTMLGRTYSSGFEADLEDWLLRRPRRTVLNPAWPWAVWYPLRRVGAFARLSPAEQSAILREHATLGRAYGDADLAHDIRLACHGLDRRDNDFVIGLVGRDLHPLSQLVQTMRRTAQTSEYIQSLGPFFVGHVLWQSRAR